jgi:hypothetical protein
VNDDLDSLDRLIKRSLLGNSLLQDDSLDLAGVLAAVLLEPEIGLLRLAKRKADGIAEVEEAKGDGGSDETGGPGDDDGSGGVEGGGGHGGVLSQDEKEGEGGELRTGEGRSLENLSLPQRLRRLLQLGEAIECVNAGFDERSAGGEGFGKHLRASGGRKAIGRTRRCSLLREETRLLPHQATSSAGRGPRGASSEASEVEGGGKERGESW